MLASEALFLGHPVAHVVQHYERQRLKRIATLTHEAQRKRHFRLKPIRG